MKLKIGRPSDSPKVRIANPGLRPGQTWRLCDGAIVTVVSLPNKDGWLRALSHDDGREHTYGSYGFVQPAATLLEMKKVSQAVGLDSHLRVILKELILEVLEEQKPKGRRRK